MAKHGLYCVVCKKHLGEGVSTCCTAGSVVRTVKRGWFGRRLAYLDKNGQELKGAALDAITSKEIGLLQSQEALRSAKQEAERKAREQAEREENARKEAERVARARTVVAPGTSSDIIEEVLAGLPDDITPALAGMVMARVLRTAEVLGKRPEEFDEDEIVISYIEVVIAEYQKEHRELAHLYEPSVAMLPLTILRKYGKSVSQKVILEEALKMKSAMFGLFG